MKTLFVSYASADKERVADLVAALETVGWAVWWDDRLKAGRKFDGDIQANLEQAAATVVVWTRNSVTSDWVNDEAEYAKSKDKLVPILFDNVMPPLGFRRLHTANLINWDGARSDSRLRDVIDDLNRFVGREPDTRPRAKNLPLFGASYSAALYAIAATAAALSGMRLLETTLGCPKNPEHFISSCESTLKDQLLFSVTFLVFGATLVARSLLCMWNIMADLGHQQLYVRLVRARYLSAQAFGHVFLFACFFNALFVDMAIFDEGYGAVYRSIILAFFGTKPGSDMRDLMVDLFALVAFGVVSLFAFVYLRRQSMVGEILLGTASLIAVVLAVPFLDYGALSWVTNGLDELRRMYSFSLGIIFGVTGGIAVVSVALSRAIRATR